MGRDALEKAIAHYRGEGRKKGGRRDSLRVLRRY